MCRRCLHCPATMMPASTPYLTTDAVALHLACRHQDLCVSCSIFACPASASKLCWAVQTHPHLHRSPVHPPRPAPPHQHSTHVLYSTESSYTFVAVVKRKHCFSVVVYWIVVEGERVESVVSCLTHSFPFCQHIRPSTAACGSHVQLIELQDIGMAVGRANDFALRRSRLGCLVVLVTLTVR